MAFPKGQFGYDLDFIKKHIQPIVLYSDQGTQQLIIAPEYQSRILTSTARGLIGKSFGWINYDLIASRKHRERINAFGGEDRIWLGPEAGQFGLFFKPGTSFDTKNYQVPAALDSQRFQVKEKNESTATFFKEMSVTNFANTTFKIRIDRQITLLKAEEISSLLNLEIHHDLDFIGFESSNTLTNIGSNRWEKQSGLISLWILGVFNATNNTVVMIPADDSLSGINTNYFGELDKTRFALEDKTVFFRADGSYKSKIGVKPASANNLFGSFDFQDEVLTIIQFTLDKSATYLNSLWEIQDNPYDGDVINSYNDGPNEGERQLGKFYELETSSPARELAPGETITHVHRTFHFQGERKLLESISKSVLGCDVRNPFE